MLNEIFACVSVVGCHSHRTALPDLWTSRAPARIGLHDNAARLYEIGEYAPAGC